MMSSHLALLACRESQCEVPHSVQDDVKKKPATEVYTLADLRKWEEIDPPIRLGVLGDPVAHSLSPQMQNAALKSCKIGMQYARFQISPEDLQSALDRVRQAACRDVSRCALARHHPRQEPGAVVPLAGICAGGRP